MLNFGPDPNCIYNRHRLRHQLGRAIVVSCADGRTIGTGVADYHSGDHGVLTHPTDPHLARQNPADYIGALGHAVTARARRGRDDARLFARSRDRHRRRHHRLDAAADRREGAAAGDRSAMGKPPRRAGVVVEGPHRAPRKRPRSPRSRRQHAPQYLEPIGGTYSSEWWWSKIWKCLKVAPEVFDAAASWVELADFVPAVLAGVDDPRRHRPLRLRRRPQGDVFRRVGRPAVEGVSRAPRSEARRAARSPLRSRAAAGHAGRQPVPRMGERARTARRHRHRDGRLRRALRRGRLGHRGRHAGQDHRHLDVRLRDRAVRASANHPRHLRHRQRLDHAGLLRHRGGAVGGRRHPQLVGRGRLRRGGDASCMHDSCRATRRRSSRASPACSRSTGTTATAPSSSIRS